MTREEFNIEKERVDKFEQLINRIDKLSGQRSRIKNGILNITTAYQHEISYTFENGLEDKIVAAICAVYDFEITELTKQLGVI